jgi:hypothetical protein
MMMYVLGSSIEQVLKMDKLAINSLECELRKTENPDYSSGQPVECKSRGTQMQLSSSQ